VVEQRAVVERVDEVATVSAGDGAPETEEARDVPCTRVEAPRGNAHVDALLEREPQSLNVARVRLPVLVEQRAVEVDGEEAGMLHPRITAHQASG
jgi:hypothetical protein